MKKVISFLAFVIFITNSVSAAEAGMPQLDPTYWASQVFWLAIIFSSIYFLIAKIFIPKIKSNIDAREDKIRKDIEEANLLKEEADKKLKKYNALIEESKVSAKKIISDSRKKLNEDIQIKKNQIEKEIQKETENAEKEIQKFKINSSNKVGLISEEIVSNIIKDIFGEDLNKSSIKATVSEITKGYKN
tara:strand:+ start:1139 stop:1705 length:567 start_codon:yes stop_codon:yes gene_type:complete